MSDEVRNRMFEPFFTTKPVGKGTGMGMASVFGTVKSHKGKILVETRLGAGTVFDLFLPLAGMATLRMEEKREAAPTPPRGLRILVVDDEVQVRDLITDMLRAGGHKVLGALGGRDGLIIFQECWREIDLVILDMIMADIDGFETYQEIKNIHPDAKVILSIGLQPRGESRIAAGNGGQGVPAEAFRAGGAGSDDCGGDGLDLGLDYGSTSASFSRIMESAFAKGIGGAVHRPVSIPCRSTSPPMAAVMRTGFPSLFGQHKDFYRPRLNNHPGWFERQDSAGPLRESRPR